MRGESRKSRSLTGIEAPDHEKVEAVQAPAQTGVWFQQNIYLECSCCFQCFTCCPRQEPTHQGKPSETCCCPAHLPPQTTSYADPSSAPTQPQPTHSSHREPGQVTATARIARTFCNPQSPPAFEARPPLHSRLFVRPGDCTPLTSTVFSRYKSTHAQHTLPNLISTTHRRRTYAVLKAIT